MYLGATKSSSAYMLQGVYAARGREGGDRDGCGRKVRGEEVVTEGNGWRLGCWRVV